MEIRTAISKCSEHKKITEYCTANEGCNFDMLSIDWATYTWGRKYSCIDFGVNCAYESNGETKYRVTQFQIKVGIVTPGGFYSSKKLPIQLIDPGNLNECELSRLMEYYHENTKVNSFDPFWHEHNEKSKNAAAWVVVATKLQADCR